MGRSRGPRAISVLLRTSSRVGSTWRVGVAPAWTAVSAVVLLVGPAGLFGATLFLPWYALRQSGLNFLHVLGPLSGLWLIVGGLLLRGLPQPGRPRSARG